MPLPEYVTINGTQYATARLNPQALEQVGNLQAVDAELTHLRQRMAIAQTARNAYVSALLASMKGEGELADGVQASDDGKPKKARAPRKTKKDAAA